MVPGTLGKNFGVSVNLILIKKGAVTPSSPREGN